MLLAEIVDEVSGSEDGVATGSEESESNESDSETVGDSNKRTLEEEFELLSQGRQLGPRQKKPRVQLNL